MNTRNLLLILSIVGLVVPWTYNIAYFAAGGSVMPGIFWRDAFANDLTTAITLDVYLSAVAFSIAVAADRAAGRRRLWAIAVAFGIGLSLALPGYLWWRLGQKNSIARSQA